MVDGKLHQCGPYLSTSNRRITLTAKTQYWIVYAFLSVFESVINAAYWFPFYYTFKFILVLWMALPQTG